jgi:cyclopropane fatty-acyl-phospholipid synthase-like methyltransferase
MLSFILLVIAFLLFISIFDGAPYVPALKKSQVAVFKLLDLKPGQTFVDLGSGDGKMLRFAAKNGLKAIGYEINPVLWFVSVVLCFRYRKNITIHLANLWHVSLPKCHGIGVFMIAKYMPRLEKKLEEEGRGVKVATIAFEMPNKKIVQQKDGVFLYKF